jgi:hypothetical protein
MTRAAAWYVLTVCLISLAVGAAVWFGPFPIESDPAAIDADEALPPPPPGGSGPEPHSMDAPALPSGVRIAFVDVTAAAGIRAGPSVPGSGIGWIDYDQDGLFDLLTVQGSLPQDGSRRSPPTGKLFKNLGGGKFTEVTRDAGLSAAGAWQGMAIGDIDNDGYPDLFLTRSDGPHVLYRNVPHGKGGRRFQDVTTQAGLAEPSAGTSGSLCSTSAAFLDFNGDGYLDLFVCRCTVLEPGPAAGRHPAPRLGPAPCLLYRNNGNGTFTEVSHEAGVDQRPGTAVGVVALDLDDDGHTDLFVTCERTGNILFRNLGNGRFACPGPGCGCAANLAGNRHACRGVDADDLDGDGRPDLFATSAPEETKSVWRNEGDGQFLDITPMTGLGSATWPRSGFGACFLDVDRDGSPDIFVTNGDDRLAAEGVGHGGGVSRQSVQLFLNDGRGHFRDVSAQAGAYFLQGHDGRAVACADYDNDGHMDLALGNVGEPVVLLHNESATPYHWIRLELRGTTNNRDAVGAKVTVHSGGRRLVRHRKGGGYLFASDPRVLIGLGAARSVDKVEIRWPAPGGVQEVGPLDVDRGYLIVEGRTGAEPRP